MFFGWWIVIACFIIGLYLGGTVFYGFTAFFEPIRSEFSWSYTQVSIASSLRGMEMSIFAPFIGVLVDRFGSRKVMLSGVIIVGLGFLLLSTIQSLVVFYGAYLLLGLGVGGCSYLAPMVVVAKWFKKKIGKALGITACGIGAGGLLIPLVVLLIDLYQWRITFVMLGLGMWAIGIPLSFFVRESPEKYGYLPDGEAPVVHVPNSHVEENGNGISFKDAVRSRTFWYLNIVEGVRMMTILAVATHIMPYLGSIEFSRTTSGFVAMGVPTLSIIGRLGFGWLSDILDKKLVLMWALCHMGLGMLAFSYAHLSWPIVVFLVFFPTGYGGGLTLRAAIPRDYFGGAFFGKILGILLGTSAVVGLLGPILGGWAFDTFGSYHSIWLVFCGLIGAVIAVTTSIQPPRKSRTFITF